MRLEEFASVEAQTIDLSEFGILTCKCPEHHLKTCHKFLPLCCYGGLASVFLIYYTDTNGDQTFILRRFLLGALLFPFSRYLLQSVYHLFIRSQMNSVILSGGGGALCGYIFGSLGSRPDGKLSALGFAAGAMLTDFLSS